MPAWAQPCSLWCLWLAWTAAWAGQVELVCGPCAVWYVSLAGPERGLRCARPCLSCQGAGQSWLSGDDATVPAARPATADLVFRAKHGSCLLQLPKQPWGCCVKPRCLFKPRRPFRVLSVCPTRFPVWGSAHAALRAKMAAQPPVSPQTCDGLPSTTSTTALAAMALAVGEQSVGCAGSWMQLRRRCSSSTQSWRSCRRAAWPLKLRTPRTAQSRPPYCCMPPTCLGRARVVVDCGVWWDCCRTGQLCAPGSSLGNACHVPAVHFVGAPPKPDSTSCSVSSPDVRHGEGNVLGRLM